ncbi:MAG: hypothetical protein ABH863_01475 [Candidatus Micrarchaeota archaeon]
MKPDLTEKIWEMEGGKRKTWWWWFWLFYIRNPKDPKTPRQLMILWSRKREKHILCNDVLLDMDGEVERKVDGVRFRGATACWYFDGNEMHEDFLVTPSDMRLSGGNKCGLDAGASNFKQNGNDFSIAISGKQSKISFKCSMQQGFAPIHKDHQFLGTLGYNILKINRLSLTGTIKSGRKTEKITGSAYFQKVFVTGPVIPWQWGLVHFRDGSYLSYNIGRVGHSLFAEHHRPLDIKLRKKLEFYDAKSKKTRFFRNLRIRRTAGKLPAFILGATDGKNRLEVTLQSYSRSLWRLQKSRHHALNTLYYHEFCVRADHFSLKTPEKEISLKDTGDAVGNCEDSKGMLI